MCCTTIRELLRFDPHTVGTNIWRNKQIISDLLLARSGHCLSIVNKDGVREHTYRQPGQPSVNYCSLNTWTLERSNVKRRLQPDSKIQAAVWRWITHKSYTTIKPPKTGWFYIKPGSVHNYTSRGIERRQGRECIIWTLEQRSKEADGWGRKQDCEIARRTQ